MLYPGSRSDVFPVVQPGAWTRSTGQFVYVDMSPDDQAPDILKQLSQASFPPATLGLVDAATHYQQINIADGRIIHLFSHTLDANMRDNPRLATLLPQVTSLVFLGRGLCNTAYAALPALHTIYVSDYDDTPPIPDAYDHMVEFFVHTVMMDWAGDGSLRDLGPSEWLRLDCQNCTWLRDEFETTEARQEEALGEAHRALEDTRKKLLEAEQALAVAQETLAQQALLMAPQKA